MSVRPTVDGIPCKPSRSNTNGIYYVYFDRKDTTLEQIERIDWADPTLENTGDELPQGYGYQIEDIQYLHTYRKFCVRLKVRRQYLGDVTGYQAEISALEASLAAAQAQAQTAAEAASAAQEQAEETAALLSIIVEGEEDV